MRYTFRVWDRWNKTRWIGSMKDGWAAKGWGSHPWKSSVFCINHEIYAMGSRLMPRSVASDVKGWMFVAPARKDHPLLIGQSRLYDVFIIVMWYTCCIDHEVEEGGSRVVPRSIGLEVRGGEVCRIQGKGSCIAYRIVDALWCIHCWYAIGVLY